MADRLVGIAADFIGEHYGVELPRKDLAEAVRLLRNGRRAQAILELLSASPKGFAKAMVERIRDEADNPAVQWAIKYNAIPMRRIIGSKEARDIIVMLELVGGGFV